MGSDLATNLRTPFFSFSSGLPIDLQEHVALEMFLCTIKQCNRAAGAQQCSSQFSALHTANNALNTSSAAPTQWQVVTKHPCFVKAQTMPLLSELSSIQVQRCLHFMNCYRKQSTEQRKTSRLYTLVKGTAAVKFHQKQIHYECAIDAPMSTGPACSARLYENNIFKRSEFMLGSDL